MTVEQRAGVYAALGDGVRLAIVDWLTPGDASPGELSEQFGLATNLLAHHLRVMEEAGVIRRVRSEGDKRRSYVQLCLDNPIVSAVVTTDAAPMFSGGGPRFSGGGGPMCSGGRTVPRVLFVCTANSARSQLAAATWNRISPVPATSAGTHPAARVHPRAVEVGRRHGLRIGHSSTSAVENVLQTDDLVVAVCDNAHEELDPRQARLHWAIPDPARMDSDEAFESAYEDITRRVSRLADTVAARN